MSNIFILEIGRLENKERKKLLGIYTLFFFLRETVSTSECKKQRKKDQPNRERHRDMKKRNGVLILWMITTVLFGSIYFTHGSVKDNKIPIADRLRPFVTCGVRKQKITYKAKGCEDKGIVFIENFAMDFIFTKRAPLSHTCKC